MGAIGIIGFQVIIALVIGFVLSIIGMFFRDICFFESLATGLILGIVVKSVYDLSTFFSVIIGVVVMIALYTVQLTRIGFWVVGGIFSLAWGFIISLLAVYDGTSQNALKTNLVWAAVTIVFMGMHIYARQRQQQM